MKIIAAFLAASLTYATTIYFPSTDKYSQTLDYYVDGENIYFTATLTNKLGSFSDVELVSDSLVFVQSFNIASESEDFFAEQGTTWAESINFVYDPYNTEPPDSEWFVVNPLGPVMGMYEVCKFHGISTRDGSFSEVMDGNRNLDENCPWQKN